MCSRPLNESAVPGLNVGPICAKKRGLLPEPTRRRAVRIFTNLTRTPDAAQVDWINLINAGTAGESCPA